MSEHTLKVKIVVLVFSISKFSLLIDLYCLLSILDRAGGLVIYNHDLIQQAVYESMAFDQLQMLHHDLGIHLSVISQRDASMSLTHGMDQLQLINDRQFYSGKGIQTPLIGLACEQLNLAGPETFPNEHQRLVIAEYNLSAGKKTSKKADFCAALYYFSNRIKFLGGASECWSTNPQLSLEL